VRATPTLRSTTSSVRR